MTNPDRDKNLAFRFTDECNASAGSYCFGLLVVSRMGCRGNLVVQGSIAVGQSVERVSQTIFHSYPMDSQVPTLRPFQEKNVEFTTYAETGYLTIESLKCWAP